MTIEQTNYVGIDYGFGETNIDVETGIRFGVINANELDPWFWEEVEEIYNPTCPSCGTGLPDEFNINEDNICPECKEEIDHDEQYGDSPDLTILNKDGYEGVVDSYNDLVLTKSPYYTHAQFCSPCAPGAGSLSNPCESGPKTYCLGHEWFESEVAPYPVYRVDDNTEVSPQ